ncbi:MAG TPA: hypothetical protein VEH04_00055 [Verrucomicrobiae bacterium]|nr:hypothetical protein [Verrucomicrobiae bacterium]
MQLKHSNGFRGMLLGVVASEILLPVLSERAWELVAAMDRLDGPRPFLLRAGLPVPNRCELRSSSVGGERVCYFDQGAIEQEVTTWQHPSKMAFRVTGNTLPGRRWLTFIDADYEFASVDGGTRVVRHTTIGTRLYPRWYWRPLERWGVTSEHAYVFANLKRWCAQGARTDSEPGI